MAANPGFSETSALRVVQLDALELDQELILTLRQQLVSAFRHFEPGGWLARLQPEVNALLRAIIWRYSVYASGSTFGQAMLNLTYSPSPSGGMSSFACAAHGLVTVLGLWFAERQGALAQLLVRSSLLQADQVHRATGVVSAVARLASFGNLLVFLQQGHFSSLLERALGLRTYFQRPDLRRQVGFDFLNRELLWHTFGEFVLFLLPLINVHRLRSAAKAVGCSLPVVRDFLPTQSNRTDGGNGGGIVDRTASPVKCTICENLATCPQFANCGHLFCYYCVKANTQADDQFACPQCGTRVTTIHPVSVSP